ncbi:MAG: hypothetical protein O3A84_13200 [Proteobacteria bacterium]|nr:hypothetical protein [Pseudomonadota bacterium]
MGNRPQYNTDAPPEVSLELTPTGFVLKSSTRSLPAFAFSALGLGFIGVFLHSRYGFNFDQALFSTPWPLLAVGVLAAVIYLFIFCGMALWGEVTVSADGEKGSVFTGIGAFGLGRDFLWRDIARIERKRTQFMNVSYRLRPHVLKLDGRGRISFGALLGQQQQLYILGVMQQRLREDDGLE